MNRANLLNTRATEYLELIGNGKVYRVPRYQRDYSWTQEQWKDLWNDILEVRVGKEDRHYLGALVVEATSDRDFAVIDGQQRLATLSVLALAVIAKLEGVAKDGNDGDANRDRSKELRNRFIGERDPAVNRRVGNSDYSMMVVEYGRSGYALTQQTPALAPEEWTWAFLEKRQALMAKRATHLWRVDM